MSGTLPAKFVIAVSWGLLLPAGSGWPASAAERLASDPARTSSASLRTATTRPALPRTAATRPAEPGVIERIEDWLDDWQQRMKTTPGSPREVAAGFLASGEYERAAKAFDRLLLENPNDPDLLMGEAMALTRLGKHDDALPLLLSVIERDRGHVAARYHYAVTLSRLDRRAEALAAFRQLLEISPGHQGAMFNLAILQQSVGRTQDALTTWRQLTERLPRGSPATRPQATQRSGRPPSNRRQEGAPAAPPAEAALDAALACEAWFHRGEVELTMHQVKDAEASFLEVTRRTPKDGSAWCNLGIARALLARWDDAIAALNEALRHEPTLVPALNQLAYVYAARFRDKGDEADRRAVLDLCARSLAVRLDQPNIRSLRDALLDIDKEPSPSERDPRPPGSE